ncbi:MAG TPA: GNAT family N-acetyltransferase [Nonomuraea sp.]|nr:GNAT family N-acetyltransferase [Nonomuraea sp.]
MTLWAGGTEAFLAVGWAEPARALMDRAFGEPFSDEDWDHALGGWHVLVHDSGRVLSHGSVVPRRLRVGDRPVLCGYVEAVGTEPAHQGAGLGSAVMGELGAYIQAHYELGALCTGSTSFYARLGWVRWRGPTWAEGPERRVRTADEDGNVLVLPTARFPDPEPTTDLVCDWRSGDLW